MSEQDEQRPPERQHVSWQARQLCQDLDDLREMSEVDLRRYCGP